MIPAQCLLYRRLFDNARDSFRSPRPTDLGGGGDGVVPAHGVTSRGSYGDYRHLIAAERRLSGVMWSETADASGDPAKGG